MAKSLDALLKDFDQAAGEMNVKKIQTDLLPFDYILDGGIPSGKIVEIYGENGTGKSTLSIYIAKKFIEKTNKPVVYIDSEASVDYEWAKKNGTDIIQLKEQKLFYLMYPKSLDEAFEIAIASISSGEAGLVIVDSLSALAPKELYETDEPVDFMKPGLSAKKQTNFVSKITPLLASTGTTLLVINQVRANIGPYGAATTVPGSYALKHMVSVRIETKREEFYGNAKEPKGIITKIKCHKNKNGIPFRSDRLIIKTTEGLSVDESNMTFLIDNGYIKRSGAFYTIGDQKFKGKQMVLDYLLENKNVYQQLIDSVVQNGFNIIGAEEINEETVEYIE